MKTIRILLCSVFAIIPVSDALAQRAPTRDLMQVSLEELLNVRITSAVARNSWSAKPLPPFTC
jgi:hypothetical protein